MVKQKFSDIAGETALAKFPEINLAILSKALRMFDILFLNPVFLIAIYFKEIIKDVGRTDIDR